MYFENTKEASVFIDKTILTLSGLFLGYIFTQLRELPENSINVYLLLFSVFCLVITIFLIIVSYFITIYVFRIGEDISKIESNLKKWNFKSKKIKLIKELARNDFWYKFEYFIIDLFRIIYLITFVLPMIFTAYFYYLNI